MFVTLLVCLLIAMDFGPEQSCSSSDTPSCLGRNSLRQLFSVTLESFEAFLLAYLKPGTLHGPHGDLPGPLLVTLNAVDAFIVDLFSGAAENCSTL